MLASLLRYHELGPACLGQDLAPLLPPHMIQAPQEGLLLGRHPMPVGFVGAGTPPPLAARELLWPYPTDSASRGGLGTDVDRAPAVGLWVLGLAVFQMQVPQIRVIEGGLVRCRVRHDVVPVDGGYTIPMQCGLREWVVLWEWFCSPGPRQVSLAHLYRVFEGTWGLLCNELVRSAQTSSNKQDRMKEEPLANECRGWDRHPAPTQTRN